MSEVESLSEYDRTQQAVLYLGIREMSYRYWTPTLSLSSLHLFTYLEIKCVHFFSTIFIGRYYHICCSLRQSIVSDHEKLLFWVLSTSGISPWSQARNVTRELLTCCSIVLRGVFLNPEHSDSTAYARKELYFVPLFSTLSTVSVHRSEELQ